MELRVFQTISDPRRISSVDIFRGLAIVAVVLFHYGSFLPHGYIGVDLFFVISGLLVGGLLTKGFLADGKINYTRFILQRGLKIWPSYYAFVILGSAIAFLLYAGTHDDQIIPLWDIKRYILFYQNYTGLPFHFSFDHVWSLCVEEHFYILLPLLFILVKRIPNPDHRVTYLFVLVGATIIMGIVAKVLSFYFTNGQDTYSATHNRIDALAWGVLLNLLLVSKGEWLRRSKGKIVFAIAGLILGAGMLYIRVNEYSIVFNKIVFHSVLPFCFFLMILGLYYVNFSRLTFLRILAYFSYNWYLWHPLFSIYIFERAGDTWVGLAVYLLISFFFAVGATIFIEEAVLAKRNLLVDKLTKASVHSTIPTSGP